MHHRCARRPPEYSIQCSIKNKFLTQQNSVAFYSVSQKLEQALAEPTAQAAFAPANVATALASDAAAASSLGWDALPAGQTIADMVETIQVLLFVSSGSPDTPPTAIVLIHPPMYNKRHTYEFPMYVQKQQTR